jgi:hypothetical protein
LAFDGARGLEACKAQTVEAAEYQQWGDIAIGGHKGGLGVSWMVRLKGKHERQVAFSSYDADGKPTARTRGIGLSAGPARVFWTGTAWTVTWFDNKGLAYAKPRVDPMPPPEIFHLGAIGPELQDAVAVSSTDGAVVAAAPFGADKRQIGIFLFSSEDASLPAVKAISVTHHANHPTGPAVAADATGIFLAWHEPDGRLAASHFSPTGKETDAACVIAPPTDRKRERFSLAVTSTGVLAMWMEESSIKTRALDKAGCPVSPVWTIAEGRWASLASLGEGGVVAWLGGDGRILSAKLSASGAPPSRGLDVGDGASSVKDPPAVASMGGKVAFGWAEKMAPTVSTKRLVVRIINGDCLP